MSAAATTVHILARTGTVHVGAADVAAAVSGSFAVAGATSCGIGMSLPRLST
jgi:hypothetical protein